MDDRMINRHLRREFGLLSWLLLGYYALMNVTVTAVVAVDAIRQSLEGFLRGSFSPNMDALMENAWGYLMAIAIAVLVLFVWKDGSFWREKVLRKSRRMTAGVFLVMICLCLGIQLVNGFWITGVEMVMNWFGESLLELLETVSGSSGSLSMFLYASLAAPVFEELLFRGWLQRSLERYGKRFSIVCSAFCFGMFHGNLIQTPYAFLMGLLLGYIAAEYHILWAVALHMFNNLVVADLLTRVTASLSVEVASMIQTGILGAGFLVSAVVLLAGRQKIGAYLRSDYMDRRCLKCFFLNAGTIVFTAVMLLSGLLIFAA